MLVVWEGDPHVEEVALALMAAKGEASEEVIIN